MGPMKEPWYKEAVLKYREEVTAAAITAFVAAVVFSVVYFLLGKSFELQQVHLSEPTLTLRLLSGLVFSTFGKILYKLKFYYVLKIILVYIFKLRGLYNAIKKIIWYVLMFIMGFYVVPWIMNAINFVLTILVNVVVVLVYFIPAIGICIVAFLIAFYFLRKKKKLNVPRQ